MDSFFDESRVYLVVAGIVQLVCAVLIAPFLCFIALRFSDKPLSRLFRAYVVFNAFLLLWGCLGNNLFLFLTYDKLYISVDRLVDWFPFIPFGQWVLDQNFGGDSPHGHLIGTATLWQLRLMWLAVAAPVWLLAYISTALSLHPKPPH